MFFAKINLVNKNKMSFLKQTKNKDFGIAKKPFYQRRGWKVFFIVLAVLIVGLSALAVYAINSGSKIFEKGISGSSLIKTLTGKETLKGESENRINVLVLGMGGPSHPGGFLTDSLMVVSIRPKEKQIAMISIPRDLYVPIENHGQGKVNSAFYDGYNDYASKNCNKKNKADCQKSAMSAGADLSSKTISSALDLPIHYYVTVEFEGFEKIIDSLGGIDVNVDKAIYDPLFPAEDMEHYSPFKIKAGLQHLDGKTALKYARSRETTSDFDRAARQQKILLAVKEKMVKADFLTNPKKISDVLSSLTDSLFTNFTLSEIKVLAEMSKDFNSTNSVSKVFTNGPDGELVDYNDGVYYLKPKTGNFKEIQRIVREIFDAFSATPKKQTINIEIYNGSSNSKESLSKLSDELELDSNNFNVTGIFSNKTISKTIIYDYTGGSKRDALKSLETKFGAKSIAQEKTSSDDADFCIILGQDYKSS